MERGCSSKLVRKEILRARKISRNELLDKEKSQGNVSKVTINVTYYPVFRHLKSQLKELHVILTCDEDHKKVFPEVPIIGFKRNKNLKSHLARAALPDINEVGRCEPCHAKIPPCQLCNNMKNTSTFKSKHSSEVYQIKINFNCNSKMVVYLIECRVCGKQYNGSTVTKFVLEPITIKARIVIFGKNKYSQTRLVTRNVFMNIICRMSITGFMTGRAQ